MRFAPEVLQRARAADAWLLDFDGTLTDYVDAHGQGLAALRTAHLPHVPVEALAETADGVRSDYYRRAVVDGPGAGLDAFLVGQLLSRFAVPAAESAVDCYQQALRGATLAAPGAHDLLAGLVDLGRRIAVVTNAFDAGPQRRRVEQSGLSGYLDDVVLAVEVGSFKPDPGLLHEAARRLGSPAGRCVYVGDSVDLDVVAATAAGMTSILVGPADHASADAWVPDLGALCDVLDLTGGSGAP